MIYDSYCIFGLYHIAYLVSITRKIAIQKMGTITGHNDSVYTIVPGAQAAEFFSGAGAGMVVLWNLQSPENGQLVAKVPNSVYALAYQNGVLTVGHNYDGLHFIDVATRQEIGSIQLTDQAIFDIQAKGNLLFVATGDGTVYVFDGLKNEVVATFKDTDQRARCIAINEQRIEIAVGYSDNQIRIYSLKNYALVQEIAAHSRSVFSLRYAPDHNYLLSASRDAHFKVWNCQQQYQLQEDVVAHMYAINHTAFSPDGKHFVTCSMDKSIKVWDAATFKLLKVIDKARHAGHGTSVNKLIWSAYNNWVVSCSDDRTISIWDINFND